MTVTPVDSFVLVLAGIIVFIAVASFLDYINKNRQ